VKVYHAYKGSRTAVLGKGIQCQREVCNWVNASLKINCCIQKIKMQKFFVLKQYQYGIFVKFRTCKFPACSAILLVYHLHFNLTILGLKFWSMCSLPELLSLLASQANHPFRESQGDQWDPASNGHKWKAWNCYCIVELLHKFCWLTIFPGGPALPGGPTGPVGPVGPGGPCGDGKAMKSLVDNVKLCFT